MDRCGKCNGTGSIFMVKGRRYPNTKIGYERAFAELNASDLGRLADDGGSA
jgi:hypothetical protein